MPSNIDAGRRFQERVRKSLQKWFGRTFDLKVDIDLPDGRSHHFDLATAERDIFAECRLANWQTGSTRVREAIDFLKALPSNPGRYLIVPFKTHDERAESFSQYVVRSHGSRMGSINVLEMSEESGKLTCVHGKLPSAVNLRQNEVGSYCKQLDRILDWVEEVRSRDEIREDRVARLRSEGKISRSIALLMHSILQAAEDGAKDSAAVRSAWTSIVSWARTEGCRATELTTPV